MQEISIQDILQLLKKNLILLLIVAFCGGIFGFLGTMFAVEPQYTASASMYVGSDDQGSQTSSDLSYSKSLVSTYLEIIKSKTISERIVDGLKDTYPMLTVNAVSKMLSGASSNNTELFRVSITTSDPVMAVDVCNKLVEILPAELIRITKAGYVEVVDIAKTEYVTTNHPVMRNTALCAMVAVVIAFVVVFLVKMLDNKIYTREDLAVNFNLPTLGVIPDNAVAGKKMTKRDAKHAHAPIEEDRKRLLGENTPFNVAEAYRMARTNIAYLPIGDGCKKIAVTSAFSGEGKTTACCNLAIALAQNGAKVLLIDADMRKPRTTKILQVKAKYGLSECIAGLCTDIPVHKTAYENLFVMASGKSSDSAAELLSSPRLKSIVESCEDQFDYIIFDMPPLNIVTDAAIITKLVDGYIMISFSGYSTVSGLKEALASLEQVEGKVLGVILAGVDPKTASYGGGKYGKYGKYGNGYYYGANEEASEKITPLNVGKGKSAK